MYNNFAETKWEDTHQKQVYDIQWLHFNKNPIVIKTKNCVAPKLGQ